MPLKQSLHTLICVIHSLKKKHIENVLGKSFKIDFVENVNIMKISSTIRLNFLINCHSIKAKNIFDLTKRSRQEKNQSDCRVIWKNDTMSDRHLIHKIHSYSSASNIIRFTSWTYISTWLTWIRQNRRFCSNHSSSVSQLSEKQDTRLRKLLSNLE